MLLNYLGHSFFVMTAETGTVFAMDPYGDFYRYPKRLIRADVCTVSHHHHDHDGVSALADGAALIDKPGVYTFPTGERVVGIPVKHDHENGEKRGDNTVFIFELENLRVAHAGDLGHLPTAEQAKKIGRLDVLLLPVGGNYTIDADEAAEVMRVLSPRVTIPMHYRTPYNEEMPIDALDGFLQKAGVSPAPMPLARLTAADMSEREAVMVLEIS